MLPVNPPSARLVAVMAKLIEWLFFPVVWGIYHLHYLIDCENSDDQWQVYFLGVFACLIALCCVQFLSRTLALRFSVIAIGAMFCVEFVKQVLGVNFKGNITDAILEGGVASVVAVIILLVIHLRKSYQS